MNPVDIFSFAALLCPCHGFWCTGHDSVASCLAVEQLAEIVPLRFLRTLVVYLGISGVTAEDMHQRFAPFVRAPQRLEVMEA